MKKRIAKLLRALANKLSPAFPMEHYPMPNSMEVLELKRIAVGYEFPKDKSSLNFDYIRPHLARQIGDALLKENIISFSIDERSGYTNIIRAEVLATRPHEEFQ